MHPVDIGAYRVYGSYKRTHKKLTYFTDWPALILRAFFQKSMQSKENGTNSIHVFHIINIDIHNIHIISL